MSAPLHLYMLRVSETSVNRRHPFWNLYINELLYWNNGMGDGEANMKTPGWCSTPHVGGAQIWETLAEVRKAQREAEDDGEVDTMIVTYERK
jgi:hypothetical protein